MDVKAFIKPGYFAEQVAADSRRGEFDCKNQVIVQNDVPVDFVFIGDSITQMWELNAYFNKPGQMILNRGISGDTTKYVLKRFLADVVQLKPKHCIMKIGVNDAWDLEFDNWKQLDGQLLEDVLQSAAGNISRIIGLAKQNGLDLIICSVLPTNMKFTNKEDVRKNYIKLLNEKIKRMCRENNLIYVDYHGALVQEDGLTVREGIMIEELHPNVFGYNIMADILRKTLKEHDIDI